MMQNNYMLYSIRAAINLGGLNNYSISREIALLNRGITELRNDQKYEYVDETDIYSSIKEFHI